MTDHDDTQESLLDFPCEFPVKIMGRADEDFEGLVFDIVSRHAPELEQRHLAIRASRDGTFIAVTATIVARSRAQLDALYEELSAHERVLMAL